LTRLCSCPHPSAALRAGFLAQKAREMGHPKSSQSPHPYPAKERRDKGGAPASLFLWPDLQGLKPVKLRPQIAALKRCATQNQREADFFGSLPPVIRRGFQPSLAGRMFRNGSRFPGVETPGYCRASLRDTFHSARKERAGNGARGVVNVAGLGPAGQPLRLAQGKRGRLSPDDLSWCLPI